MKELNEIVTTKLTAMINDGSIEKMIEERLESLMQDTIKSAMGSYSGFGKSLTKSIEDSIGISLHKVSFPEYNHFVAQLVQEKYGQALDQHAAPLLEELLKDALSPVPAELNAQKMLDEVKSCWEDDARNEGHDVIEIEWSEQNASIYMTLKHPEYEADTLHISFYNHGETEGQYHIGYINEGKQRISGSIKGATQAMGLASYFYKLYCRRTKISGLKDVFGMDIDVNDY